MAFTAEEKKEIREKINRFLKRKRPPEEMRGQLDLDCILEGQSVIIYEVRPRYDKPEEILRSEIARASFVKSRKIWKIYWMRANLKWYPYDPNPTVGDLDLFFEEVEKDKFGCFFG